MKKFYSITIAALLAVLYLQTSYINSLYKDYIYRTSVDIDREFNIAISRELSFRNYKKNNSSQDKPWKEKLYYKRLEDMTSLERDSLLKIAPLPPDTIHSDPAKDSGTEAIDLKTAREKGMGETKEDLIRQLDQDYALRDGYPIDIKILDSLFISTVIRSFPHKIQLYNQDTLAIDSIGLASINKPEYVSGILPLGTKGLRFLQLTAAIPMSDFIRHQWMTLGLTACLIGIVLLCLLFQLTEIRLKNELLLKRENSVNGVIHDLKSPLNSVITLLGWLKTGETKTEKKELLGKSQVQLKHQVNQIESLLVTARKDRRKIVLNKTEIDLVGIVEGIKEELSAPYPAKPFSLETQNHLPADTSVRADAMYIGNVIRNLIENALKYSDDGVIITVTLEQSGHTVAVSVADNGWGIPRRYQKKIFTQFYQVPRENRLQKGYGIGLAQVKSIINEHGGNIKVESEENRGTVFTFTLPVS